MKTDISKNRKSTKWNRRELFVRVLWGLFFPVFRMSPRVFWGWRRWILRIFGAKIGNHVHIYPTVRITIPWNLTIEDSCAVGDFAILYALGPIHIGPRTTISQGAHLCAGTHDWKSPDMPLIKSPITIGQDVWIAAEAFVGPDVTVGDGAIVGARAVVMKNIPENVIVVGNPATIVAARR